METLPPPNRCFCAAILLALVVSAPAVAQTPPADDPFTPAPAPSAAESSKTDAADKVITPTSLFTGNLTLTIASILPFVVTSLIAIWLGIERLTVLRRGRVIPRPFAERFLTLLRTGQLDAPSALALCEENGSPIAQIFAHAIRKWGKPSVEVEQAVIDGGDRQVAHLRKNLRAINGIATVSPLIGLLGTVIGMMIAFFDIAGRTGNEGRAQELAVGIVTALSATALGLAIAIPCLVLYMYLAGRVDSLVMEMDELAQEVVNNISAEGLAANPPVRSSGPRARAKAAEPV